MGSGWASLGELEGASMRAKNCARTDRCFEMKGEKNMKKINYEKILKKQKFLEEMGEKLLKIQKILNKMPSKKLAQNFFLWRYHCGFLVQKELKELCPEQF